MKQRKYDIYTGIEKIYFHRILEKMIKIGNLRKRDVKILDFGCGYSKLKELLPNKKIIGYDINPEVTEVDDWKKIDFDVVFSNGVFYLMTKQELQNFLIDVYKKNPAAELLVNISRRLWINKLFLKITRREDDWTETKTLPDEELKILLKYLKIIDKTSVFFITDIYYLKFNKFVPTLGVGTIQSLDSIR